MSLLFYNDLVTIFENMSYNVGPALAVSFKYFQAKSFALWIIVKMGFQMSSHTFLFKVSFNSQLHGQNAKQDL